MRAVVDSFEMLYQKEKLLLQQLREQYRREQLTGDYGGPADASKVCMAAACAQIEPRWDHGFFAARAGGGPVLCCPQADANAGADRKRKPKKEPVVAPKRIKLEKDAPTPAGVAPAMSFAAPDNAHSLAYLVPAFRPTCPFFRLAC